jgi:hypothetical protein
MTVAFPKPERPIRGTAAARRHMDEVAKQPCIMCSAWPVELHHPIIGRGARRKSSDFDVLPMCPPCHAELHASTRAWREKHGRTDFDLVPLVLATMEAARP